MSHTNSDETLSLLNGKISVSRRFIRDSAYLAPQDLAFIGGSLIEGLGNECSDVDVHVIRETLLQEREIDLKRHYRVLSTERSILSGDAPLSLVFLVHTVIPGTNIKVDVEYRTRQQVDELVRSVDQIHRYAVDSLVLLTKYLSERDMAFIHRLFNARPLSGEDGLEQVRARIGIARFRYLLYRWKASDFSVLLDMLGAWHAADWLRCAELARDNMISQFHAYTHLVGNTNYNRKWLVAYAARLAGDGSLLGKYVQLLCRGLGGSSSERQAYVLATVDFVDEVFEASRALLARDSSAPSGSTACEAVDRHFRAAAEEYSEMEMAYRKRVYAAPRSPTREWFTKGAQA